MGYLDNLNTQQKQAVVHKNGPLLVIAGAGAGKTRVITARILHLIESGVAPESILAVTFTNKAAKEMRERVEKLVGKRGGHAHGDPLPHVSTFHSLAVDILRENYRELGVSKYFAIFDRSDSLRATRQATRDAGYDPGQFEPRRILGTISKEKGNGVSFREFEARDHSYYESVVSDIWKMYDARLAEEKALDFDDLLLRTVMLLESRDDIRKKYQNRFVYIHIDEFQDTNTIQHRLARALLGKEQNICVVGDLDQCIYTWRGAEIKNMLHFEKEYPNTTTIRLEENYRSTSTIIAASNRIIEKNVNRPEKTLFTKNDAGEKITLYSAYDEADEARFVTKKVRELTEDGVHVNNIAILYRTNFQSRVLEEAFLDAGIPYHVLGTRFFDRKEVKDVLSFVRLAEGGESAADLARVVNAPPRGIGKVTLMRMTLGKESECTPAIRKKIADFRAILTDIKDTLMKKSPSEAIKYVIMRTGIEEHLVSGTEEDHERLMNVHELVTLAKKYDRLPRGQGIETLLTDAALATDQDELLRTKDGVKLMTVHAAKGLEFDVVFITGLEDGLFPYHGDDAEVRDPEEERRLFYVALTRARKKVFVTHASLRTIFGSEQVNIPSEFITDIDDELLHAEEERVHETGKTIYLDLDEL